MKERIKELAEQAFEVELSLAVNSKVSVVIKAEHLERFADLVRQDEREACAKLCEEQWGLATAHHAAELIRARGNHEPT